MRCFASSATAIFTPASAYFIRRPLASVPGAGALLRPSTQLRISFERRGGSPRFRNTRQVYQERLERVEDSLPAHDAGMKDGIRISEKTLANLARIPSARG